MKPLSQPTQTENGGQPSNSPLLLKSRASTVPCCERFPIKKRFVQKLATVATLFVMMVAASVPSIAQAIDPIDRRIPPKGIELPTKDRDQIMTRLNQLQKRYHEAGFAKQPNGADIGIYLKAVSYALLHNEFYKEGHGQIALELLEDAEARIEQLNSGESPWLTKTGTTVRGYFSSIDGSAQPYGLVIPEGHDFERPSPLYVWLHGRGDKKTDLHFIHERKDKTGEVAPDNAIVLHPFGRHCIGFKSAGEVDVLESIAAVCRDYKIDEQRIVLMGFSMGGAGCWHVGAHYTDRFVAMSPGAGFAETAEYNRLTPDKYPPAYEQRLWGTYDVPCYTRNLFNLPVVAYSGEKDKQIQAARVMEAAFERNGQKLPHVIGPGMGHKYHPESLKQILAKMQTAVEAGKGDLRSAKSVSLQTRTLRYNQVGWVEALSLFEHWKDARIDAEIDGKKIRVTTKNVQRLRLFPRQLLRDSQIEIDGQTLTARGKPEYILLEHVDGLWHFMAWWQKELEVGDLLTKRPGLQGPIDDAFLSKFLVVIPTGDSRNEQVTTWVDFELEHLRQRWQALFRGDLPIVKDTELSDAQIANYNLILFGDLKSNQILAQVIEDLPLRWTEAELSVAGKKYDAETHVPVMIHPNPLAPANYVVLNSGPTFRESHDRTNSLQNPKLPDWAVLDIRQPPNGESAGKVVAANFFDEQWKVK